ncbi:MAG: DUF4261 domain-containing protein [Oscillospiraceae bacterium]
MSMSKKIIDQDTNDRVLDRNQMMMAQLLFTEKPDMADPNALKAALEREIGAVENISDKPDMPMFSVAKYKAVFKDAPQGMPPLADYLAPREFSAENIDEIKRSQFWDYKDGAAKIDEFKWCVDVFAMMSAGLHYKEQAELFLAQVGAALQCYPTCEGIYVLHSGKLTTPEDFEECRQFDLSGRFIRLAVNARFFTINGTADDKIVDTIGFFAFGGADVQVHFHGMDPNHVVNYVYNIASYQFDNEFPIKSGETVDSLDENGSMQWEPQWKTQYEDSLIQPVRTVLDINCGEFAAGTRQ